MLKKLASTCAALAMLLSAGCGSNGNDTTGPSPLPEPNSTLNYTALGASDAIGWGASQHCIPFGDCPNALGYVHVAARELQSRGYTIKLTNLGWPGATISSRLQNLGNQYGKGVLGNFMDQEVPFIPQDTNLVTIFGGANDVNVMTAALGGGAGGADPAGYIAAQVSAFGSDFTALLNGVRARAPSARIVVLNLPNMAAMPFLAFAPREHRLAAQVLSVEITRTVMNPLAARDILIVDLMCDARTYQRSTYSGDGFHPSDAGYAWIASEVVAAATTAYRQPADACAAMTAVQ